MNSFNDCLSKSLKKINYDFIKTDNGIYGLYCPHTESESWIYILMDVSKYINLNDEYYFLGGFSYKATIDEYLSTYEDDDLKFFYNSFKNGERFIVYCVAKNEYMTDIDAYFYYLSDFNDTDNEFVCEVNIHPYMMEELFDE